MNLTLRLSRKSLLALLVPLWSVGMALLGFNGVQPVGDRIAALHATAPGDTVLRVTVSSRAPLRAWQRAVQVAREKGARTIGVVGPDLPGSVESIQFSSRIPWIEEAGLPADRDGLHRRVRFQTPQGGTFIGRLLAANGIASPPQEGRIPRLTRSIPSLNAVQLQALDANALEGKTVLVSGAEPWGTTTLATPDGLSALPELIARCLSRPVPPGWRPGSVLAVFAILGIFWARLLERPGRRLVAWCIGATGGAGVLAVVMDRLGHPFPIDPALWALWGGTIGASLLRPDAMPSAGTDPWQAACEVVLARTAGLACWVAEERDGAWISLAQAGDTGPLPVDVLSRLAVGSPRDGSDHAFLSALFHRPDGVKRALLLQPGDSPDSDPQPVLSVAADLLGKAG
jgi:hypothetical protein